MFKTREFNKFGRFWCITILVLNAECARALRLYSDTDLGSGDYNNDELQQYNTNSVPRSANNATQLQVDLRRKLEADINEFIDLIPADEVATKMLEFYRNDYDVHRVFDYLNSEEFKLLEKPLVESKEYLEVEAMLSGLGANIQTIRRRLDGLLGFSKLRSARKDEKHKSKTTEESKLR